MGKVLGLPDQISITFEGQTVQALCQDFERAVDFYLEECARKGKAPHESASGKLMLRVPPEVHSAALTAAQAAGLSLNQWATRALTLPKWGESHEDGAEPEPMGHARPERGRALLSAHHHIGVPAWNATVR